jgi:hypothetical protein
LAAPDALAIPADLADAVERNSPPLPGFVCYLKDTPLAFWEMDLPEGHALDRALPAVEIADLEFGAAEGLVVANAGQ